MAKKRRRREVVEDRRPPIAGQQLDYLFAAVVRDPVVFEQAHYQISEEYFHAETENWLRLIWEETLAYYGDHEALPDFNTLGTMLSGRLENDGTISDQDEERLNEFMSLAFAPDLELNRSYAISLLKQFLQDRLSRGVSDRLTGHTLRSVHSVLSEVAEKAAAIQALDAAGLTQPFDEGWDAEEEESAIEQLTTGYQFLDRYMDGGPRRTESLGLLGPFGGGKTTLGVMLSVAAARRAYREWIDNGRNGSPKRVYHFSYEAPVAELRLRSLACAAQIRLSRLTPIIRTRNYAAFSTRNNLRDEERLRYRELLQQGQRPPGERERFDQVKEILNACWRPVDMRPVPENHGRGDGMVDEIAALIQSDLLRGESGGVELVIVDYAQAAIERYLEATGADHGELRHLVSRFPFRMKNKVGVPFNTPTWTLHQLNTESNALMPGRAPKMTSAAEGRAFPENCDFCFMIGTADSEGRALFTCRKHRRTAPGQGDSILRLDGDMATFVDETHAYQADTHSGRIIERRESSSLAFMPTENLTVARDEPDEPDEPAARPSGEARSTNRRPARTLASRRDGPQRVHSASLRQANEIDGYDIN